MGPTSEPLKVQVAVKARSLHAQAESLEAQADAQTLQVLPPHSLPLFLHFKVSTGRITFVGQV